MFSRIKRIFVDIKELKYLAYHDALTNLYNRNWLYKNKSTFYKYKWIYFLDIDNLHEINKLGHSVGDEYILTAIRSIKLNEDDILIRYAGDEFILLTNDPYKDILTCYFSYGKEKILDNIDLSISNADKLMIFNKTIKKKRR